MANAMLGHFNVSIRDPKKATDRLCSNFDWRSRWEGYPIHSGQTVHVGSDNIYVALYSRTEPSKVETDSYSTRGRQV